jgi:hypothetical protein
VNKKTPALEEQDAQSVPVESLSGGGRISSRTRVARIAGVLSLLFIKIT